MGSSVTNFLEMRMIDSDDESGGRHNFGRLVRLLFFTSSLLIIFYFYDHSWHSSPAECGGCGLEDRVCLRRG